MQDARNRLAALSSRYDAIEELIERLVQTRYSETQADAARDELDDAVRGFLSASRLDASAVEQPAFVRMIDALQRHARRGLTYHPSSARLLAR